MRILWLHADRYSTCSIRKWTDGLIRNNMKRNNGSETELIRE